jgi:hypothetical protein
MSIRITHAYFEGIKQYIKGKRHQLEATLNFEKSVWNESSRGIEIERIWSVISNLNDKMYIISYVVNCEIRRVIYNWVTCVCDIMRVIHHQSMVYNRNIKSTIDSAEAVTSKPMNVHIDKSLTMYGTSYKHTGPPKTNKNYDRTSIYNHRDDYKMKRWYIN